MTVTSAPQFAASDKKAQKTQFKGFVQMLSAMKSLDFPESTIREIWLLSEDVFTGKEKN